MQISNTGGQSASSMLQEVMQGKNLAQKENTTAVGAETASGNDVLSRAMQAAQAKQADSSLMSNNFAGQASRETKYTEAQRVGLRTERDMGNRQNNILSAGLAALGALDDDGGNYAKRNLIGKQAARRMQEEQAASVHEESERNLAENRRRIEEKAQEAATPKDAEGNPLAQAASQAPAAEIAPAGPATAAPAPAAPEPDPETAPAASAPAAPQVDLVV